MAKSPAQKAETHQALVNACKNENLLQAQMTIGRNPSEGSRSDKKERKEIINMTDPLGRSPLHHACNTESLDVINFLLDGGAEVNKTMLGENTPLHLACLLGHTQIIKALLAHKADPLLKNDAGQTPIELVMESGNEVIINNMLNSVIHTLSVEDKQKFLGIACQHGCYNAIEMLIAEGAEINSLDPETGNSPFHQACMHAKADTVLKLMNKFSNLPNNVETTPLALACQRGNIDAIKVLLESPAYDQHRENFQELLESIDPASLSQNDKNNFLLIAYQIGNTQIAQRLITAGADPNLKNDRGETLLNIACKALNIEFVSMLLENGADPNYREHEYDLSPTPLHSLFTSRQIVGSSKENQQARGQFVEILQLLLQYGADPNIKDATNKIPLANIAYNDDLYFDSAHHPNFFYEAILVKLLKIHQDESPEAVPRITLNPNLLIGPDNTTTVLHTLLEEYLARENSSLSPENETIYRVIDLLLTAGAYPNQLTTEHFPSHSASGGSSSSPSGGSSSSPSSGSSQSVTDPEPIARPKKIKAKKRKRKTKKKKSVAEAPILPTTAPEPAHDQQGTTYLHKAAAEGKIGMVQLLLKHDANPSLLDDDGMTPLSIACRSKNSERPTIVTQLVTGSSNESSGPNQIESNGNTLLYNMFAEGNERMVQQLIELGADPNLPNNDGIPPLHRAYAEKKWDMVKLLLQYGADPNLPDEEGITFLHRACQEGNGVGIRLLLITSPIPHGGAGSSSSNNNLNWAYDNGSTLLHHMCSENNTDRVTQLLELGADPNRQDNQGMGPLHHAYNNENWEMVKLLLQYGADPNLPNNEGMTPLHSACMAENEAAIRLLVTTPPSSMRGAVRGGDGPSEYHVDLKKPDGSGQTLLHHMCIEGNEQAAQLLLELGADPNQPDQQGMSALHHACQQGHAALIQPLLDAGANPVQKNINGKTPIDFAQDNGNEEVIRAIPQRGRDRSPVEIAVDDEPRPDNSSELLAEAYRAAYGNAKTKYQTEAQRRSYAKWHSPEGMQSNVATLELRIHNRPAASSLDEDRRILKEMTGYLKGGQGGTSKRSFKMFLANHIKQELETNFPDAKKFPVDIISSKKDLTRFCTYMENTFISPLPGHEPVPSAGIGGPRHS